MALAAALMGARRPRSPFLPWRPNVREVSRPCDVAEYVAETSSRLDAMAYLGKRGGRRQQGAHALQAYRRQQSVRAMCAVRVLFFTMIPRGLVGGCLSLWDIAPVDCSPELMGIPLVRFWSRAVVDPERTGGGVFHTTRA